MSNGAYAGLRLAARAGEPDPATTPETEPDEDETTPGCKKKDTEMTDEEHQAAVAQARADGFKAANERSATVMASEHYTGNEKLAATLLANDKMGADEIVTALAAVEKPAPAASSDTPDAEAAARAEMRDAIGETGNSEADAAGGGKRSGKADAGAIWDQAIAANNPGLKTA